MDAAEEAQEPSERYLLAHTAIFAIAASALVGAPRGLVRRRPIWEVLPRVMPELSEWASYFEAIDPKRRVVAAGASALVSEREADDLVRDARAFARAVETGRRRAALQRARADDSSWRAAS